MTIWKHPTSKEIIDDEKWAKYGYQDRASLLKALKDVGYEIEMEEDKEIKALAVQIEAVRKSAKFRPGGTADLLFREALSTAEKCLSIATKGSILDQKLKKAQETLQKAEKAQLELTAEITKLRAKDFNFDAFVIFCNKLYRTLSVDGPKMQKAADLPKFIDWVYRECRKNQPEPDMP